MGYLKINHLSNTLNIKRGINQQDFKIVDLHAVVVYTKIIELLSCKGNKKIH